jgi:hypothetical protein
METGYVVFPLDDGTHGVVAPGGKIICQFKVQDHALAMAEALNKERDQKIIATRQWQKPKLARKPQQQCGIVFGDSAAQIDLIETLRKL